MDRLSAAGVAEALLTRFPSPVPSKPTATADTGRKIYIHPRRPRAVARRINPVERRRHPARRACIASDDFRRTLAAHRSAELVDRTLGFVDRHRSRDPAGRDQDTSQDIPGPPTTASRRGWPPLPEARQRNVDLASAPEPRHLRDDAESEVLRYGPGKPRSSGTARRVCAHRSLDPSVTPVARAPWMARRRPRACRCTRWRGASRGPRRSRIPGRP